MPAPQRLSRATILTFAVSTGIVVANLYYNQPLVGLIAASFGAPASSAGMLPALTQAGYATGLFFLVPLGDAIDRRRLFVILLTLAGLALVAAATARSMFVVQAASYAVGVFSVMPQLLLPYVASRTPAEERGRTIGTIMAGLLTGILLARTVSGYVGRFFGWREMYWAAAVLMVAVTVAIVLAVPPQEARGERLRYRDLLRSLAHVTVEFPVLREISFLGAMAFGAFSAFWSTLAFFLATPPWHFGSDVAGLFGVVGIVGVVAAPVVGRMADRSSPRRNAGYGLVVMIAAFAFFFAGRSSLAALVAGVVLLDLGVQTTMVSNQTRLYGLSTDKASRLNTVFMTSYFLGGGIGSALAAYGWSHFGWSGVCAIAVVLLAMAFAPYLRRPTRGLRTED